MLLHEFGHVDADEMIFRIEQERRERLAQLGLAHAGGAEEEERAVGLVGVGEPRARAPDRVGDEVHRLVLADDALVELFFHREQLVAFALHHFRDGDSGRARHDFGDFLRPDLGAEQFRLRLRRRSLLCLLQLRFAPSISSLSFSSSSLMCCEPCTAAFSAFQTSSKSAYSRSSFFISLSISVRRFCEASSFSFLIASRSILSWMMRRSSRSMASGLESISILMRAAASSIRSIALSGRKRSVM